MFRYDSSPDGYVFKIQSDFDLEELIVGFCVDCVVLCFEVLFLVGEGGDWGFFVWGWFYEVFAFEVGDDLGGSAVVGYFLHFLMMAFALAGSSGSAHELW